MRFEALDITIESRGRMLWVILAGPFHNEQVPNIREKIAGLIESGNLQIAIDMEQVTLVDEAVGAMLLEMLNRVRGKGGELRLVFRNAVVAAALAPYRHVIPRHEDSAALARSGLLRLLAWRTRRMARKTGVRLSAPVAWFVLFIVVGWLVSLALVIGWQTMRIRSQQEEIRELTVWREQTLIELQTLQERQRVMEQLGIAAEPASAAGRR